MMHLRERKPMPEEHNSTENKKCCAGCETTKTPLWRSGPAGPKSLCNACGIRYRKNRRSTMVGFHRSPGKKIEKSHTTHTSTTTNDGSKSTDDNTTSTTAETVGAGKGSGKGLSESLKVKIIFLGKEVTLQKRSSIVKKRRCQRKRELGEEEQAAFSLMALSRGSVFA